MSIQIKYNFPLITLPLQSSSTSPTEREIQIASSGIPIVNIQLNNENFSAYSFYISSIDVNSLQTPGYLIIKCVPDVNAIDSKCVFLAIPLEQDSTIQTNTDVDNIINSQSSKITINTYITDKAKTANAKCSVSDISNFPVTIALTDESKIKIKTYSDKKFYNIGNITGLKLPDTSKPNGTLVKTDLDWILSCDLVGEDASGNQVVKIDTGSSTANQVSLFMMVLMVLIVVYFGGPLVYKQLFIGGLGNAAINWHYPVNVYIGINMVLLGFILAVYGLATSDNQIYAFIGVVIGLSYLSGTRGLLNTVADQNTGFFDTTESPFAYFDFLKVIWLITINCVLCGILFLKNNMIIIPISTLYLVVPFFFLLFTRVKNLIQYNYNLPVWVQPYVGQGI